MTNENENADSNGVPLPKDGLVIPPQDLLNFLGHLSHGAIIGAVTSGALKDHLERLTDALEAGDIDKAKQEADGMMSGIALVGTVVCNLGKELAKHDQMVFKYCKANGVKVKSATVGLISEMEADTEKFVRDFFEDAKTHRFTDKPPEADKPKPTDKPKTSGRFPEGFDFTGGGKDN
jgi:hypothetical protein